VNVILIGWQYPAKLLAAININNPASLKTICWYIIAHNQGTRMRNSTRGNGECMIRGCDVSLIYAERKRVIRLQVGYMELLQSTTSLGIPDADEFVIGAGNNANAIV
jgi:hypothetical protein